MRCKITLSYNGANYFGSQSQLDSKPTILNTLYESLKKISIDSKVVASGRTDRGVHAFAQVCHIDLPPYWNNLEKLKATLNKILPSDIYIKKIQSVDDSFHARYSVKTRAYRYFIKTTITNPFEESFVSFLRGVNFEELEKNIALFVGEWDFKYFMKNGSDTKNTTRTIYKAFAYRYKGYIVLYFEANGFLRTQIRLMVGALLTYKKEELLNLLECKKRLKIKPAPPNGLYLAKIKYN